MSGRLGSALRPWVLVGIACCFLVGAACSSKVESTPYTVPTTAASVPDAIPAPEADQEKVGAAVASSAAVAKRERAASPVTRKALRTVAATDERESQARAVAPRADAVRRAQQLNEQRVAELRAEQRLRQRQVAAQRQQQAAQVCAAARQLDAQALQLAARIRASEAAYRAQMSAAQQMAGQFGAMGVDVPVPSPPDPRLYTMYRQVLAQRDQYAAICRSAGGYSHP